MIELARRSSARMNTNGGDHPCVLLNDAMRHKGDITLLRVHFTSSRKNRDLTCVFKKGEDRLITRDCRVYYARARIMKVSELVAEIRKRRIKVRLIGRGIYLRIIEELLRSPYTDEEIREYMLDALRQGKAG